MRQTDYLDQLRRALDGLAPDIAARTLAYYEQRFIDGLAAGRSEAQVAADLGEPKKIALSLRASSHARAFQVDRTPASFARMAVSALGLAIFNLFMVIPAMVCAALLGGLYIIGLTLYVAGIAVSASGLSDANELVLDFPLRQIFIDERDDSRTARQTRISIGEDGIHIGEEAAPQGPARPAAQADSASAQRHGRNPNVAVRISTDTDPGARSTQVMLGLGTLLAGIGVFLASLVVTTYAWRALKRYARHNITLLQGR